MATDRVVAIRHGALGFRVLSAGRGTPVVYFHSFHDREPFPPFLERLADRHSVYAPLHPGAAGSTGVETLDDLFDLTLAYDELLDALDLDSAHLVGHFFGAMVAAEIAAVFPRRASRLVLISPLGLWRDDAPSADVVTLPQEDLMGAMWADPDSDAARRWAAEPADEDENAAAQIESVQRRAAMAKFVWPIPDKGLRKRLHRISAPTLVLWGDGDRVNPLSYAEEWHHRIKGAALSLRRGGHMIHQEAPDVVASAVAEFLR
jgi:pimeloyl-ACP methyl ester carboxylesterase